MLTTWRRNQETAGAFDPELLRVLDEELEARSVAEVVEADAPEADATIESARGGVVPDHRLHRAHVSSEASHEGRAVKKDVQTILVRLGNLREGMVLDDEVRTLSGAVLLCAGETLSADSVKHIQQFVKDGVLATSAVAVLQGTLVTDSTPPLV